MSKLGALLKRQFWLCFYYKKITIIKFLLDLILFIFLNIIFGLEPENIPDFFLFFCTQFFRFRFCGFFNFYESDLQRKNINLIVTETNNYLICFSYFLFLFIGLLISEILLWFIQYLIIFLFYNFFSVKAILMALLNTFVISFFYAVCTHVLTHFGLSKHYSFFNKLIIISIMIILFWLISHNIENFNFLNVNFMMTLLFYPFIFLAELSLMFFVCFDQLKPIKLTISEVIIFILLSMIIFIFPYFAILLGQKKHKNYLKV